MSAVLHRLQPTPDLVDQAYRALADAIGDGTLAPGERIVQEALAERLAVSRQPVLQALRLLKADGLVEDAPGRGLQVAQLDATLIEQVYAVRGALDALAARLAASQRALAPAEIARAGQQAARSGDVLAMVEADLRFHQAIYAASRNPLIERSAAAHWCQIRRAMGAVLRSGRARQTIWDEHAAIADAIAAGDAEAADRLAREHAVDASRHLGAALTAREFTPAGIKSATGARALRRPSHTPEASSTPTRRGATP